MIGLECKIKEKLLSEAVAKIIGEATTCETEAQLARTCLTVAEELTNSKFSFIGEVKKDGQSDTITIINTGRETSKISDLQITLLIGDILMRGLLETALFEEKTVVVNDTAAQPNLITTQGGHPQLTSFLGIPLKRCGKTVGMIILANKDGGYNYADQEAMEKLSIAFIEALMYKRSEILKG